MNARHAKQVCLFDRFVRQRIVVRTEKVAVLVHRVGIGSQCDQFGLGFHSRELQIEPLGGRQVVRVNAGDVLAARQQDLRSAGTRPVFGRLMIFTLESRSAYFCITAREPSFDPSLMQMNSKSRNVCARMESIVSATNSSALYTGMRTEMAGEVDIAGRRRF